MQVHGRVAVRRDQQQLVAAAQRVGQGWLKINVGGTDYYVESSQARTDLKLSGKPKCDNLGGATGHAASRGLGEEGCEP